MDKITQYQMKNILLQEVMPALGCTEPIAIALAAAKAREVLGELPEKATILCSGNIIKNAKSVIVPNAEGLHGIEIAASLGILGGDSSKGLKVLENITHEMILEAKKLIFENKIKVQFVEGIEGLYIVANLVKDKDQAIVELKDDHSSFYSIQKDGEYLLVPPENEGEKNSTDSDLEILSIGSILEFADTVDLNENKELTTLLDMQIEYNTAIAEEGLAKEYGSSIGKTLLEYNDENVLKIKARAMTAAGSDARMGGCSKPVMINSGSGNQGMTVSIPVIVYAKELKKEKEDLYRALILSNLIGIYQKRYIGKLSAFCGVVTAAAASGAGIGYLLGFTKEKIEKIIINTVATTGGMVCDGAKPSCASKISLAVENAISAVQMADKGVSFSSGEGIVGESADETIKNIGQMAKLGMRTTDVEILNIMLSKH